MSEVDADASRGSLWHSWDPHIHAPGTAMNDQFSESDPWGEFLQRITEQDPPIRALGVTDYFLVDIYEKARKAKVRALLTQHQERFAQGRSVSWRDGARHREGAFSVPSGLRPLRFRP